MTKLVAIILIVSALLLVVACKPSKAPTSGDPTTSPTTSVSDSDNVKTGNIIYLEYGNYGTMAQPDDYFKVELLENGSVAVKRQRGMGEEEFITDGSLMVELKKIYDDGRVNAWKESYQPDVEILDGYSWNLEVKFDNGSYKYSHGSNASPSSSALKEFSNLIWNLKK